MRTRGRSGRSDTTLGHRTAAVSRVKDTQCHHQHTVLPGHTTLCITCALKCGTETAQSLENSEALGLPRLGNGASCTSMQPSQGLLGPQGESFQAEPVPPGNTVIWPRPISWALAAGCTHAGLSRQKRCTGLSTRLGDTQTQTHTQRSHKRTPCPACSSQATTAFALS